MSEITEEMLNGLDSVATECGSESYSEMVLAGCNCYNQCTASCSTSCSGKCEGTGYTRPNG